jgi:hypothetical protein
MAAILASAPTPQAAQALSARQLAALLTRAGRQRGIDAEAMRLHELLGSNQIRQTPVVEQAMGMQLRGLLRQLDAICQTIIELEEHIDTAFHAHPDAPILSSVPGLGVALGARLLAEIGDDRGRFADARGLKAFAGAAPVTRSLGKSTFVHARRAKNDRIAATGYVWALVRQAADSSRYLPPRSKASSTAGKNALSSERIRLVTVILSQIASCCARVSTCRAATAALSAGRGRCAARSVRKMLASTFASKASDLPRELR